MPENLYYIVVRYSSWWTGAVIECAVVETSVPLDTLEGIKEVMDKLRKDHPNAVLLNWKKLNA